MRIFIADTDGGYRRQSRILGRFVEDLTARTGAREAVRIQWPAPGSGTRRRAHTWESASAAGVADLRRLVRLHPSDQFILIGACSGSRVIHDWMESHPESLDRVAAVGFVADPYRPADRWLEGTVSPGGQGVAGARVGPVPDRSFWVSVPGDPLSSVETDSLLRGAVRFSTLTPDQVYEELAAADSRSRTQLAARMHVLNHPSQWSPHILRRLDQARAALERFDSGVYGELYAVGEDGPSPLDQLAAVLAAQVSEGDRGEVSSPFSHRGLAS